MNHLPPKMPWYVWPLRPIIFWAIFLPLLYLWPIYTILGFLLFSYGAEACIQYQNMKRNWGMDHPISMALAPLKILFVLIILTIGGRLV